MTASFAHVMAISLQRYWKLKEDQRFARTDYGSEELLCANWNPEAPSLLQSSCPSDEEPVPPQPKAGH